MSTTVCVKIGGSTIDTPGMLGEFAQAVGALKSAGHFPIVVHGGGKDIGRHLAHLGKQFTFVEGLRVTDAETLQTVQMVLSGDVNKRIVNELLLWHVSAIGISGVDAALFEAEKLALNGTDIGFVGTIARVNTQIIDICRDNSIVPVVSPVSRSARGEIYNVNADSAASELAMAIRADHLVFISDVDGVLVNGAVKREIRVEDVEELAQSQHVTGGMLPKLRSAADAVRSGVGRVHICGWHGLDTLTGEVGAKKSHGTIVY